MADDVRQRQPMAGEGGKEAPASFLSPRTFPHLLLVPTTLPSQLIGSSAAHMAGPQRTPAAQGGGGGWSDPSHHFPHQMCGWVRRNVVDILRSSPAFFTSPGVSSSPLKSVHRTARSAAAPSGRSLGQYSGRSRPSFFLIFVSL